MRNKRLDFNKITMIFFLFDVTHNSYKIGVTINVKKIVNDVRSKTLL